MLSLWYLTTLLTVTLLASRFLARRGWVPSVSSRFWAQPLLQAGGTKLVFRIAHQYFRMNKHEFVTGVVQAVDKFPGGSPTVHADA